MDLYLKNSLDISRITTCNYSTSFSLGIRMLKKKYRPGIYAIYGFVRLADEIVDTFHEQDKERELKNFTDETFGAIQKKYSSNPILHSFQWAVSLYGIEADLISAFLYSMSLDITRTEYNKEEYDRYIYGSAEVVGLMCLNVFYIDDKPMYETLKPHACALGRAFQKVNFLRDIQSDLNERGRKYFPGFEPGKFDNEFKKSVEAEILNDFNGALPGIAMLRKKFRFGVYLAYRYYMRLLRLISQTDADGIMSRRISVSPVTKSMLLAKSYIRNLFNFI